jgi:prepilin-type N-terminal cleavage/methylation domain-containing protein
MDDLYNRVARRRHSGQGGFTLIELLVVIAVLAVLAGIVIFNVTGVANRGALSACQTDTKSVQTASDAFYADNTQTYASADKLSTIGEAVDVSGKLVPTYLHTAPVNGEAFSFTDISGTVVGTYTANGVPGTTCPIT